MNQFAIRLKNYRIYAGETQQELANAIHVNLRTLRSWEQGIHCCSFDDLIAICKHYGITSDWLLGLDPSDSPYTARKEEDKLTFAERKTVTDFEEFLINRRTPRL